MSIIGLLAYWSILNPVLAAIWATVLLLSIYMFLSWLKFKWLKSKLVAIFEKCNGIDAKLNTGEFVEALGKAFS